MMIITKRGYLAIMMALATFFANAQTTTTNNDNSVTTESNSTVTTESTTVLSTLSVDDDNSTPVGIDKIQFNSYEENQVAGDTRFNEPAVRVVTQIVYSDDRKVNTDVTTEYVLKYSICDENGTEIGTDKEDGLTVYRIDPNNGTKVNKSTGDVILGSEGTTYILVKAVPKAEYDKSETLTAFYRIITKAANTTLSFVGEFNSTTVEGYDYELPLKSYVSTNPYNSTQHLSTGAVAMIPSYSIKTTLASNAEKDVTDCFTLSVSYDGNTDAGKSYLKYNDKKNYVYYESYSYVSENDENYKALRDGTIQGTLTLTFTPTVTAYNTIIKKVYVTVSPYEKGDKKQEVSLSLTKDMFNQENVTEGPDGDTIHVYRYGLCDDGDGGNYTYTLPVPLLMNNDGAILPTNSGSEEGKFYLIYKIVNDSTYYDDCETTIINAGQETGSKLEGQHIRSADKAGLVKVEVFAGIPKSAIDNLENWSSMSAKSLAVLYSPLTDDDGKEITQTDSWGTEYYVYTEPKYFYFDFMHRRPILKFTPNPEDYIFVTGETITMNDRFEVSAYMDTSNNNEAGELYWGDGADGFSYSLFISNRNANFIKITNWGDDTKKITERHKVMDSFMGSNKQDDIYKIAIGDSIYVGTSTGDTKVNTAGFIVISESNIDKWSEVHPYIKEGDYEWGTKYESMKGWGNENWLITFTADGQYTIPYTIYPWNHTKWCKSTEIGVKFRFSSSALVDTKLELDYYMQVVYAGKTDIMQQKATVVAPLYDNLDVTELYNITYAFKENASTYTTTYKSDGTTVDYYTHTATGLKLYPGGKVEMSESNTTTGDVKILVTAKRKDKSIIYNNPASVSYTLRIVSNKGIAQYEIISTCKENACGVSTESNGNANARYTLEKLEKEQGGKMHFISKGSIYRGTIFHGVPGIKMIIGETTKDGDNIEWSTEVSDITNGTSCCSHEAMPVVTYNENLVSLDDDGIPYSGSFYQFQPSVNGYLTIDARMHTGHRYVLVCRNSKTGNIETDEISIEGDDDTYKYGDHTFTRPLQAGEQYFLYDATKGKNLRLHGFAYKPAFITDRSTTVEQSTVPISATTFKNGLSTLIPSLCNGENANVTYEVAARNVGDDADTPTGITPTDYLEIDKSGNLEYKKMTIKEDGTLFKLRIKATITSTDENLKDNECVNKIAYYDIRVMDIPTFMIPKTSSLYNDLKIGVNKRVTTTNIPTDITMTFGGWAEKDGDDKYKNNSLFDQWSYKSTAGAASRIGSPGELTIYNKTIDGFNYFCAAANNPLDERNNSYLVGSEYSYASGRKFEMDGNNYNTTYNVPCRGAFLKFEPRESGTIILYLVQNGSVDYYDGSGGSEDYQIKWRPLYITDHTGKPVTMDNNFNGMNYLPSTALATGTQEDADNNSLGAYTMCVSRCNIQDDAVEKLWASKGEDIDKENGCSFDWSKFKGSSDDRQKLMSAWKAKGEQESIIQLDNGGYVVPHKAYVRYAFNAKAGKTYFVFQFGSKFEFGGFSFVPNGFPNRCKYKWDSSVDNPTKNTTNQERTFNAGAGSEKEKTAKDAYLSDLTFTYNTQSGMFYDETTDQSVAELDNINLVINDIKASELSNATEIKRRSFTKGEYDGICFPFSVTETQCEQLFGKDYTLLTCDGMDGTKLHFIRHAHAYIEAGRPYLIKPAISGTYEFKNVSIENHLTVDEYDSDEKISATEPSRFDVDINHDGNEWTFRGVYSKTKMPAYSYFIKKNGLYFYDKTMTIGGYRAFFEKVSSTTTSEAKAIEFSIEDLMPEASAATAASTTGILVVDGNGTISEVPTTTAMYNINGQKISNTPMGINTAPHGIYIVDGKKYVK